MAQGDVPRQLAAFFELKKIKKFQNESRESVKINQSCIPKNGLLLTQLDNQETLSSAEERFKEKKSYVVR